MPVRQTSDFQFNLRTVMGYLTIAGGMVGGIWFMVWLYRSGDIIETLHKIKMTWPHWVWITLKYGLSFVVGMTFIAVVVIIGVLVLGVGRKK